MMMLGRRRRSIGMSWSRISRGAFDQAAIGKFAYVQQGFRGFFVG